MKIEKNILKFYIDFDNTIITIRSIELKDIENLRIWKNSNKKYFFHNSDISKEQQIAWFNNFTTIENDYMFVVEKEDISFGCMGVRLFDNKWDAYNIILGKSEFGGHGYMSKCFNTILLFAYNMHNLPITLKVLKHNTAVKWYLNIGFEIISSEKSFYNMVLKLDLTK